MSRVSCTGLAIRLLLKGKKATGSDVYPPAYWAMVCGGESADSVQGVGPPEQC